MSITTDNIPPEVVEAAAIEMAPHPWTFYTEAAKDHFRNKAHVAILAALNAWPGAKEHTIQIPDDESDDIRYTLKTVGIILPLPQKENEK